jgi:hypothetical protein
LFFTAERGFAERDFQVVAEVGTSLGRGGIRTIAGEQILEDATAPAEDFAEDVEGIMEPSTTESTSRPGTGPSVKGRMTVLIVCRPALGIA